MATREQAPGVEGPSESQMSAVVLVALAGHCCCVWPFTRRNFGTDALFPAGPAAIALMVLYAGFGESPETLTIFLPIWCFAIVIQRCRTLIRKKQGVRVHTRDLGEPWLARKLWPFGQISDLAATLWLEPLIAVAAGGLIYAAASASLGLFVMAAAASLFVRTVMAEAVRAARVRSWQDTEMEMQEMAKRFRQGR